MDFRKAVQQHTKPTSNETAENVIRPDRERDYGNKSNQVATVDHENENMEMTTVRTEKRSRVEDNESDIHPSGKKRDKKLTTVVCESPESGRTYTTTIDLNNPTSMVSTDEYESCSETSPIVRQEARDIYQDSIANENINDLTESQADRCQYEHELQQCRDRDRQAKDRKRRSRSRSAHSTRRSRSKSSERHSRRRSSKSTKKDQRQRSRRSSDHK
jgi:hypothetical protein